MVNMMDRAKNTDETVAAEQGAQLSALADGQLQGIPFDDALALFEDAHAGARARATWHAWHVVGEVLRSSEGVSCRKDADFLARLTSALQQEPGLLPEAGAAPALVPGPMITIDASVLASRQTVVRQNSANEPVFYWKWVAGLSSVAAALALSWNLVGGSVVAPDAQLALVTPQVALPAVVAVQAATPAQAGSDVMLRNPQLDALIAAHSQLGGSSALQMPSGFLRSATFDAARHSAAHDMAR